MRAPLAVHGLVWAGTRTGRHEEMSRFLAGVLGIPVVFQVPGYVVHQLPDGAQVEVFTPDDPDHEHFTTGPVPGLLVDDVATANRTLVEAGIELLGPLHEEQGHAWQHFRAPDGHIWEVTHRPVERGRVLVEDGETSLRQVGEAVLLERAGQVAGRAVLSRLDDAGRAHWRTLHLGAPAGDVDVLLAAVEGVARLLDVQAVQATVPAGEEMPYRARGWVEVARVPGAFRWAGGKSADGVQLVNWLAS